MGKEFNVQGKGQPENFVLVNAAGVEVFKLEKNEIELLFAALDKLQVSGIQIQQFVLSIAAKLLLVLPELTKSAEISKK